MPVVVLDGSRDPYASEFVFLGTGFGVYAFDRTTGTWGRYTTASGLPGNRIRALGLDDGILWVATDSGLASADVRVEDWQVYDLAGRVEAVAFDADYAWAGGSAGLHRYDKWVEEWETVIEVPVNGMVRDGDYLWLATDSGAMRYAPGMDRLETTGAPRVRYRSVLRTSNRLWFFGDGLLAATERDEDDWSEYPQPGIGDTAVMGDTLFTVVEGAVTLYDPSVDDWRRVEELADVADVRGLHAGAGRLLLATGDGLLGYGFDEQDRTWFRAADGLRAEDLSDAYEDSDWLFAVGAGGIQYAGREEGIWRDEPFSEPGARREQLVYLDEAGAHLRLLPRTDLRLSGRAYYSDSRTFRDGTVTGSNLENVNLSLVAGHESGRTGSAYYDDSDKDQVRYGASYRGVGGDVLQRAEAGHLETEYFEFGIVPTAAMLGGTGRLELGRVALGAQGGRLQSRLRHDFFTGRTKEQQRTVKDVAFARNRFYRVDTGGPGFTGDTVFVDDRDPGTNGIDTREDWMVGGITGDFDPLIRDRDYSLDATEGIVRFGAARGPDDVIVFRAASRETVLQSDSVRDRVRLNRYAIGPGIVPGSFRMTIEDTLGQAHPLSTFGIDSNLDGLVEPEYVDHNLGWLRFPENRPFPDAVYDDTVNIYTMRMEFETQSTFYYLGHTPVERNSDRVLVDGTLMERGLDYVIDYTSGILLFLHEDDVSDFSDVEVAYSSVERAREDLQLSAQSVVDAGDGLAIAPGFSRVEDRNLFHLSGRLDRPVGSEANIRFVPQVAVDTDLGWAQDHRLTANVGCASLSAGYRGYSEEFEDFGAAERRYGRLSHGGSADLVVEPLSHVRLDGGFAREWQSDTLAGTRTEQHLTAKASYLNPALPGGYVLVGQDDVPDSRKRRLRVGAGYDAELAGARLRLDGVFRNVTRTDTVGEREGLQEYIGDFGFTLPFPVGGDVRFRHAALKTGDYDTEGEDELRVRLNVDAVPGLSYYGSYDTELADRYLPGRLGHDLSVDHGFYNSLNVAPGRWWRPLSLVNFTFGTGSSFDQYVRLLDDGFSGSVLMLAPLEAGCPSSASRAMTAYGQVYLQPVTELVVRLRHARTGSGSAELGLPVLRQATEDEVRVEYEPGRAGRLTGAWERRGEASYPAAETESWFLDWTMPWSDRVRTRLTGTLWSDEDRYIVATEADRELGFDSEVLVRFGQRSFVTGGFGAGRSWGDAGRVEYDLVPGAGVNLNLFGFLYLQLDYESTFVLGGTASHFVSGKVTAQF